MGPVICEYCDSVYRYTALPRRAVARCEVCDSVLYRTRVGELDEMIALAFAAALAFVAAMAMPLLTLTANGSDTSATLLDAVLTSYDSGVVGVAVIATVTLFVFPMAELALYLWILVPLRAGYIPPRFVTAMHLLRLLKPWSMVEVFMLGIVVAVMKLGSIADVKPEAGVFGFAALSMLLVALSSFDRRELWDAADKLKATHA